VIASDPPPPARRFWHEMLLAVATAAAPAVVEQLGAAVREHLTAKRASVTPKREDGGG
jgi:hypothetical protein